jgi:hypothetical protein
LNELTLKRRRREGGSWPLKPKLTQQMSDPEDAQLNVWTLKKGEGEGGQ